jgi:molybdopterin converting factor small subunit
MEVTVYGRLRAATGGKTVEIEVPSGATLREALDTFVTAYPRARAFASNIYIV